MDMNGPEIYGTIFALAPSFHDINTIWTGSDDGLMHITRDGGETWANITPPDMPIYSRISIIDESRHHPGTAYVAANRYQVDDREPYVWRTTDYGASWTKIVIGVASGHFARSVREDPKRPGLLFLATEHGVYISFDAGDQWNSLQLNLPDTPIRDLVVKDDDIVLGSHGRGFWILDDIGPLREHDPDATTALTLFTPADPIRGVSNLTVQYHLAEEADRITIEIVDAAGNTIRSIRRESEGGRRRVRGPECRRTQRNASAADDGHRAQHLRLGPAGRGRDLFRGNDHLERTTAAWPQGPARQLRAASERAGRDSGAPVRAAHRPAL